MPRASSVDHPSRLALYWFLRAYELEHRTHYRYSTMQQLALDTGLSHQLIMNIVHDPPDYIKVSPDEVCTNGAPPLMTQE